MWIKKKEIEQLSEFVKGYSSGEELDIRVNREGSFNILTVSYTHLDVYKRQVSILGIILSNKSFNA